MGRISFTRGDLFDTLIEIAGFKAGLALTPAEVREQLPMYREILEGDREGGVRLRSEDYEQLVQDLLVGLGAATSEAPASPIDLYFKYHRDEAQLKLHRQVSDIWLKASEAHMLGATSAQPFDFTPVLIESSKRFGEPGFRMAQEILGLLTRAVNESPWNRIHRYVDWKDVVELKALFKDAGLQTQYGKFFDQRFVDYLHSNFESIDAINPRKFEALAAEYFTKEGAHVEIGRGSKDEGIDASVWWPGEDLEKPAALVLQCKRQKDKVGAVIVRTFYADILHARAASGLIVTTQGLTKDALLTRTARRYPIDAADRNTLKKWIEAMRSSHLKTS